MRADTELVSFIQAHKRVHGQPAKRRNESDPERPLHDARFHQFITTTSIGTTRGSPSRSRTNRCTCTYFGSHTLISSDWNSSFYMRAGGDRTVGNLEQRSRSWTESSGKIGGVYLRLGSPRPWSSGYSSSSTRTTNAPPPSYDPRWCLLPISLRGGVRDEEERR
ncbi:hypothetical protein BDM02DRAFT_1404286 [Thelephora ganbajun]|uniref:Uncharacterized protein n=1 Tax=Thelephora ganbajun TaxID=370292 RepID=A0ACB6Z2E3_THEGA|nr:hypothetical protein BDM02DRAFT_1404286 [Thelephora ganbajun]